MRKLANSELHRLDIEQFKKAEKTPLIVILDNVRSLNNVGSGFRTCEYAEDTLQVVERLKAEGVCVISIEQAEKAVMLNDFQPKAHTQYAVIFGNEVKGVSQEVVSLSDGVIEIPQYGTKHSLNVSVSAGIVIWEMTKLLKDLANNK